MEADAKKNDDRKLRDKNSFKHPILLASVIFATSLMALIYVYNKFPKLAESEKEHLKIPFSIEDAKELGLVLSKYKEENYKEVVMGIMLVYIFLQAFAIPGSLFLSILLGYLFDFWTAIITICTCSALGATICFILSDQFLGKRLLTHMFPEKVEKWAAQVDNHKEDLCSYMLFLRMTPILPNWFINLVAPIIGVPLKPFVVGTFFGVAPPSFIAIETGKTLFKMTSSSDAFSVKSITMLGFFSVLALLPIIFRKYFKSKLE